MGRGFVGDLLGRLGIERPEPRAWALYDWANSAVYTTIVGALFPVYFVAVVAEGAGLGEAEATRFFSWTTTVAIAAVAVLAPLLGAFADIRACKKKLLAVFAALGAASCSGLFFVEAGDLWPALLLFAFTNVGAAGSLVFYDALLPHVASPGQIDRLSGTGFGLGYLGGGLLLLLHVLWIENPTAFGLPAEGTLPVRLAFLSVGVWWLAFSVPLFRRVPEPLLGVRPVGGAGLREAAVRLRQTFHELRKFRQAFLMLLAFLVYNDGIATVIRMAAVYSQLKGFGMEVTLKTFLLVQFVGFPAAIVFGRLAERFGPKRMIVFGLAVYVGVCFYALSMTSESDFIVLGLAVGAVQGGCQALGRSLFARFVPRHRSGEFFALLAVGEKFAGIGGPLVFSLAIEVLDGPEPAILSLIPFFVVGAFLVTRLDVAEGRRVALEAERAWSQRVSSGTDVSS